jgi:alpha-beta hydrolase superfamily lysophospholipase
MERLRTLKFSRQMIQASSGIFLLLVSLPLGFYPSRHYTEKRYVVDAASCRMNIVAMQRADVPELPMQAENGSVVLFHGISANGMVMQYLARSFAELGMRVFIVDLPGHGHSPGPFSPEIAESCSAALLRGLAARAMIEPDHTILAGHSMGGAIALRIADKFRPAGVIAISPAPMQTAHGVGSQNLLFHGLPKMVPNTRIMAGQFEPAGLVANAADLAASAHDPSVVFSVVRYNTHVSVLFSPTVARESQAWAAKVLSLPPATKLPSRANALALLLGLLGIVLVAGPFLRDVVGKQPRVDVAIAPAAPRWRGIVEIIVIPMLAVFTLRYFLPLRFIRLFEGDYLASFFLIVGAVLAAVHFRATQKQISTVGPVVVPASRRPEETKNNAGKMPALGLIAGAALAALLLQFLVSSWFELMASSAWLSAQRWLRFPLFAVAAFCFFFGLELLAGPVSDRPRLRYLFWLLLVGLAWLSMVFAGFHLRSGEILLVLLSPYFALQFILAGLGIQLVRKLTGSATAAAVFGAILLTGFCLALFPVT